MKPMCQICAKLKSQYQKLTRGCIKNQKKKGYLPWILLRDGRVMGAESWLLKAHLEYLSCISLPPGLLPALGCR